MHNNNPPTTTTTKPHGPAHSADTTGGSCSGRKSTLLSLFSTAHHAHALYYFHADEARDRASVRGSQRRHDRRQLLRPRLLAQRADGLEARVLGVAHELKQRHF